MKKYIFYALVLLSGVHVSAHTQSQSVANGLQEKYHIEHPKNEDQYISKLLKEYNLENSPSPFSYKHTYEVHNSLMGTSRELMPALQKGAEKDYEHLENSYFYRDIRMLLNPLKVRKAQLNERDKNGNRTATLVSARTSDGEIIYGTWFNRGSDTLVVVGAGFTNEREKMAPLGDIFADKDVLFFDYRGHGKQAFNLFKPSTWPGVTKALTGIDPEKVTFGVREHLDINAIVSHVKNKKRYRQVVGLGVCYSTMMMTKAAAYYPRLFDKLILNGSWLSLGITAQTLAKDPGKLDRPQKDSPLANMAPFNKPWFQKLLLAGAEKFFGMSLNTTSMLDYIPFLDDRIDILFIQGKNDALISNEEFAAVLNACQSPKVTTVITPNEHIRDHIKSKRLYAELCHLFIENPYRRLTQILVSPRAYEMHKRDQHARTTAQ